MQFLHRIILLLFLLIPPAIYFSLELIQPRYFAIGLIVVFVIRIIPGLKQNEHAKASLIWAILMISALIYIALNNSTSTLLLYPVVMNLGFFLLFFYSLITPPTIIEQIARLRDPDLPDAGIRYTRKVTTVWCGFFLLNGFIAAWTAIKSDYELWGLYNGLISYLLMGTIMITEYWIRGKVRKAIEND